MQRKSFDPLGATLLFGPSAVPLLLNPPLVTKWTVPFPPHTPGVRNLLFCLATEILRP